MHTETVMREKLVRTNGDQLDRTYDSFDYFKRRQSSHSEP